MQEKLNLSVEIMKLLRIKAQQPHDYVNPHFLSELTELIDTYYPNTPEDDVVDKWIRDMWSA